MSGIGVGLLHLSCGRQKATLGSFSGAGFWTGWAWILLGFGSFGSVPNGGRSCHRRCHCSSIHSSIHYMVFAWFFHAFEAACLAMSGIGVGLLHLSCGRQKATLGSFSGAGFWTGWAWILLGFGCFGTVPNGGRSCHRSCHCSSIHYMVFARFFHAFEAACLVMSGIGVGLSSSFLWASEGDVRQFFGGWFLDRLGLNPAGVGLFRLRAERRPELPPKLPLQLHPQLHPLHGFCMVFSCFRSCLSGDVRHWRWPFFIFLVGVWRRR